MGFAALIIAFAGLVDAIVGRVWDLAAVLVAVIVLVALDVVSTTRRPAVELRPDLERWIHERAVIEGETVESVASRAVATFRMHLSGEAQERQA